VNVVDSSAWLEFFANGPNAGDFEVPILDTESLLVPSIAILEVYRHVLRTRGREEALVAAAAMRSGQTVDLGYSLALEAAEIGLTLKLPLADSVIYASARAHDAKLWTQDADFDGLDGVEYRPKRT
jgi:predicted nucleic acid-binding protein